jgi:hypothetical protein
MHACMVLADIDQISLPVDSCENHQAQVLHFRGTLVTAFDHV